MSVGWTVISVKEGFSEVIWTLQTGAGVNDQLFKHVKYKNDYFLDR